MKEQADSKELIALLLNAPSAKVSQELIELLLTPNELVQLKARYEIVKNLIQAQKTQREIAKDLKLSIAKITRGSNELKRRSKALLSYLGAYFS